MKYVLKLALKNTFFNKKKTAAAFVGFFLCALFFSLEITLIYSYTIENNNALDNTFGTHDGIYCVKNDNLDEIIGNSAFDEVGIIPVYFISDNIDNSTQRRVIAGAFDDTAEKLCRFQVTDGVFPSTDNEIMLEQSLLSVMFCGKSVGDKIDFSVDGDVKSFIICGTYANISTIQWNADEYKVPFVNAVVKNDFRKTEKYIFTPMVRNDNTNTIDDDFIFCPNMKDNYDVLSIISGTNSNNGMILLISVLSAFSLIVMITLSYITKKGEEKTIGLWKSVGFSVMDIYLFYIAKILISSVPALISGSMLGYLIGYVIGGKYGVFSLSILCFGAALVVLLISYLFFIGTEIRKCVVDNISSSIKRSEIHSTNYSTNNPILLYSIKNFLLNAREIAAASISLFLAVFILVISSSVMKNAENYLFESKRSYDVLLNFAPFTVTSLNISRYGEAGLSDEEYSLLKKETEDIIGIKTQYVYEVTDDPDDVSEYDENVINDKRILGFPSTRLVEGRLLGVDDDTIASLSKFAINGSVDLDELKAGKSVVLCKTGAGDFTHAVGDKITLGYAINENPDAPSYDEITYHEIEVTITGLILLPTTEKMLSECIQGGYLWSEKAFDSINIEKNYSNVFSKINDDSNFYEIVNEFKSYYGKLLNVYDYSQDRENYEQFFNSFKTVSLIISVGLSLFSILNTATSALTRIARRKKLFGCLRAIGLTQLQMTALIFVENFVSAAISSVLGIICGITIVLFMATPISGLIYATLLIIGNVVSVAIISCAAAKKCFAQSVVECVSCSE